jgi:hypothetical protein
MWALFLGYAIFYILSIVHLRSLKRKVVCSLRFELHTVQAELVRHAALNGAPLSQSSDVTRVVNAILDRIERSTPAALFIHGLWVTPLVVLSEIFGWESFDRAFSSTIRESTISALQSSLVYYIKARDKNLR